MEFPKEIDFNDTRYDSLYKDYWEAAKEDCISGLVPTEATKNNKFWTRERWWMQSDLNWKYMENCKKFLKNKVNDLIIKSKIVDLGCGKGHPLFKFSNEWSFKKVIGIEITKKYYDICLKNLNIMNKKKPDYLNSEIEIYNCNVLDYKFDKETNFIYMYNPFGRKTMSGVLNNLIKSLREEPRDFYIIYKNAIHRYILTEKYFEIIYSEDNEKFVILKYKN